jgi:aryl-alcohol dehydrogenase-like predicted oxidoreductase
MERIRLGRTGIEVSRLGIGTGTTHPSGSFAQALMDKKELADLLLFAFDKGINFWDTAFQYKTYPHFREALRYVKRSDIVLTTKLVTSSEKATLRDFTSSLKELNVDYFDICLLHGVRTKTEFERRLGAFYALFRLKDEGKIRAIGLSSHGLSALQSVLEIPKIDVVWARINYAGLFMDARRLGLYDELATIPWLKKIAKLLPEEIKAAIRPNTGSQRLSPGNFKEVEDTLKKIHAQSKGIVGMKVLAEGHLRNDVKKAIEYVRDLPFIDAFIVGMMSKREIEENCSILSR